jgi:hypothetical protein
VECPIGLGQPDDQSSDPEESGKSEQQRHEELSIDFSTDPLEVPLQTLEKWGVEK